MSQQLRRRYKHVKSLEDRLTQEAKRLREEAELLLLLRAQVLRRAPQAETPSHVSAWPRLPGLQPPKRDDGLLYRDDGANGLDGAACRLHRPLACRSVGSLSGRARFSLLVIGRDCSGRLLRQGLRFRRGCRAFKL
jgi:hypothetical protein